MFLSCAQVVQDLVATKSKVATRTVAEFTPLRLIYELLLVQSSNRSLFGDTKTPPGQRQKMYAAFQPQLEHAIGRKASLQFTLALCLGTATSSTSLQDAWSSYLDGKDPSFPGYLGCPLVSFVSVWIEAYNLCA